MFTVRFDREFDRFKQQLADLRDQAPKVMMTAVNSMAFAIRREQIKTIDRVFPTAHPKTKRNIKVFMAKRQPIATVWFSQIWEWSEFMLPHVTGGPRRMKRGEKLLGHYYVPGIGARLDAYGNMQGGHVQQILSYLGKLTERGHSMNRTMSRKNARARGKVDYFMIEQPTKGLAPGVYMRTDKSAGQMLVTRALAMKGRKGRRRDIKQKYRAQLERGVIPVMLFVKQPPRYNKRYPFYEVANQVIRDNAHRIMSEHIERAKGRR